MGQKMSSTPELTEAEMRHLALQQFFARRGIEWPRRNNVGHLPRKVNNWEHAQINARRRLYPDLTRELEELRRTGL